MAAKQYDDNIRRRAIQLRRDGVALSRIRDELGPSVATIRTWMKEEERTPQQPPQQPPLRVVPPTQQDDSEVREHDEQPKRPEDAPVSPFPAAEEVPDILNYRDMELMIAGAYKTAARLSNDQVLIKVIDAHADAVARDWCEWIRSEPKVEAFLRKMMVGTPAGKLVYDHVSIGIGYAFGRAAVEDAKRRERERAAADAAATADDGSAVYAA